MFTKIALWCLLSTPLFSAEKNMLFIGNSFTMRLSIPSIIDKLMEEGDPENSVKTEIVGYGGRDLFWHWELLKSYNRLKAPVLSNEQWESEIAALNQIKAAAEFPACYLGYSEALSRDAFYMQCNPNFKTPTSAAMTPFGLKITNSAIGKHKDWMKKTDNREKFDFVVLQSWQDVTESSESGYFKYAQKFAALATEIGAKPVLYLTAPQSQNGTPVTGSVKKEISIGTCHLAQAEAKKINALVVPVPLALMLAQDSTEPIARTLTFRYKKDFHPNNTMAYLTACTFYAALTGKSPEGLKLNTVSENTLQNIHGEAITEANKDEAISSKVDIDGGPLDTVFDDETRLFLQRTAWKAVELYRSEKY